MTSNIRQMIERFGESRRFFAETCDRLEIAEDAREAFMDHCGNNWPGEDQAKSFLETEA